MAFRFDRFATLYIIRPLRRTVRSQAGAVPILMYHAICEGSDRGRLAYYETSTSPIQFDQQMAVLQRAGYATVTLAEAISQLRNTAENYSRKVVITFDDGFRDFYQFAYPVLKKFGFSATMFLPSSYIGHKPMTIKGKEYLSWEEVRELHRNGIVFGSHTVSHPQLYGLSKEAIREEVVVSKNTIEQNLGAPVTSFAYPYAFPGFSRNFKGLLRNLLQDAGYEHGVCTTLGRPTALSDQFFLERLPVNRFDDQALLLAKLEGAYDWTKGPQSLVKWAKNWQNSRHVRGTTEI